MFTISDLAVLSYSDDTLASFRRLFLVPETGQSVIVFWCQKSAPDRTCSISGWKPAKKLNCDWSVWADDNTACLFKKKQEIWAKAHGMRESL